MEFELQPASYQVVSP